MSEKSTEPTGGSEEEQQYFIHVDMITEIEQFLSTEDFLTARLVSRAWNEAAKRHDTLWKQQYDHLVNSTLPKSHLFDTYTIESDHPKFKNHPLRRDNKKQHLSERLEINLQTHSEEEVEKAFESYWRSKSDPVITGWVSHLPSETSNYKRFETVIERVSFMEEEKLSHEQVEYLLSQGLVYYNRYLLAEFAVIPANGVLNFCFVFAAILKCTSGWFDKHTSWNYIFPLMYVYFALALAMNYLSYIAEIYFFKAGIHTVETTRVFLQELIFDTSTSVFLSLTFVLFHLRCLGVQPFASHAILCFAPLLADVLVNGIIFSISMMVHYRVTRKNKKISMFVCFSLWVVVLLTSFLITMTGLKIDMVIKKVNWAVFFIPADLGCCVVSCLSGCALFLQFYEYRQGTSTVQSEDAIHLHLFTVYTLLLVIMQIIISVPSIPTAYSFICVLVMGAVWHSQTFFLVLQKCPDTVLQKVFLSSYIQLKSEGNMPLTDKKKAS